MQTMYLPSLFLAHISSHITVARQPADTLYNATGSCVGLCTLRYANTIISDQSTFACGVSEPGRHFEMYWQCDDEDEEERTHRDT